jgi:predicted regulator of Ras-like GTPase activity (Roadblock/LC7/MglB family)
MSIVFLLRHHSSSSDDDDDGDEHHNVAAAAAAAAGAARERTFSFTTDEYEQLQIAYNSVKADLNRLAEKLGMMCAVYKDMQIARLVKLRIAATSKKYV